jgi:hypothetical protein
MIKNIYIAVQIKENEKRYAYVIKTTDNNNLLSVLNVKGIITANIWSKTDAYKAVEYWNEQFKKNGTYMFDSTF